MTTGFLTSGTWVAIAVTCFVVIVIRQFGLRGFGTLSPSIATAGEFLRVAVVAAALWLTGIAGAVVIAALAYLIFPPIADLLLFPMLKKGTLTTFGDFRSTVPWRQTAGAGQKSLDQIFAEGDQRKQEYLAIAQQPAIARVLAEHDRGPEDVQRIADGLSKAGLGFRIPKKVVSDPKLLSQHYRLETEGFDDRQIAIRYVRLFGHVT